MFHKIQPQTAPPSLPVSGMICPIERFKNTQYIDLMEQKELDLDINIADRVIVNADPKLTQKVLSNLLSNAVRYSPAREKICITLFSGNGQADFSISNTGVQISEEALPAPLSPEPVLRNQTLSCPK